MSGHKGIAPVMERLGAAVRRAADEFEFSTHVRYQIKRIDRQFEIWDTQSSKIHGPFKTQDDAQVWIRRHS